MIVPGLCCPLCFDRASYRLSKIGRCLVVKATQCMSQAVTLISSLDIILKNIRNIFKAFQYSFYGITGHFHDKVYLIVNQVLP